nr:MAG TPA: hypothetical protein [Caudoviricetes sp.]
MLSPPSLRDVRVEEWRYLHAAALHETGREEIQ